MVDDLVALVTGANKGLGKETARQLAERGMTVVVGSRHLERGTAAVEDMRPTTTEVFPVRLDVTDADSVVPVASLLAERYGRLDVLVNNAGTVVDRAAEQSTATEFRDTYEVNVFGVVTMMHTMLPLLRNSSAPRVVNVSSTTASLTLTSGGTDFGGDADKRMAYSSSKTALNMLTLHYAHAFGADPDSAHIKVNAATPGYTATDLTQHRGTRSVSEGARIIVDLATLPNDGPTGGFFNDQGSVPW